MLTVREAVYDGTFGTPKTEAGLRQIPLSEAALSFIGEWKQRAGRHGSRRARVSTRTGNVHLAQQRPEARDLPGL